MENFNMTEELTALILKMEKRMSSIEKKMAKCDKERAVLAKQVESMKSQQLSDIGTINMLCREIEVLKKAA